MEGAVFSRPEIREIFKSFVFVELHLDGAPNKISEDLRAKHAALAEKFAHSTAMPSYVVLNPENQQVISIWNWENADPKVWKRKLEDGIMRWKNQQPVKTSR